MSRTPAVYNIRPQRRADFTLALQFKDNTGTPINLSGWDVVSQVWDQKRSTMAAEFTPVLTNASTGHVTLQLTFTQTEALSAEEYYYDVMLISPTGLREYYLEGIVRPSEGYSAPVET